MSKKNKNTLKDLIDSREAILFLELGALIHDLGKLSKEFLISKSRNNTSKLPFKHNLILDESSPEFKLFWENDQNLEKLAYLLSAHTKSMEGQTLKKFINNKIRTSALYSLKQEILLDFGEILRCHHRNRKKLQNCVSATYSNEFSAAGDTIDSGVDKSACINANKQSTAFIYIATAFGSEYFNRVDLNKLSDVKKKYLYHLRSLFKLGTHKNSQQFQDFLSQLNFYNFYKTFKEYTKDAFSKGLAETRRSANDILLWDHSLSSASLFKSFLAGNIVSNGWINPRDAKWSFLLIRFNGYDYFTKSTKISDIIGRKEQITLALNLVRQLLEFYVPIGNEIYRDENGSVFLILSKDFDNNILRKISIGENIEIKLKNALSNKSIIIEHNESLGDAIKTIFKEVLFGEVNPVIIYSSASRGAVNLGKTLGEIHIPLTNIIFEDKISDLWDKKKFSQICVVCKLKPADDDKQICNDCLNIRKRRLNKWNKNRTKKETIWIDEVADKNSRVALIVSSFDLTYWLNGMWLNTFFIKTLNDYHDINKIKNDKRLELYFNTFYNITNFRKLCDVVKEGLDLNDNTYQIKTIKNRNTKPINVKEVFDALAPEAYKYAKNPSDFFQKIVVDREEDVVKWVYQRVIKSVNNLNTLDSEKKARLLILSLFRKNPSFARIKRTWNTTHNFWNNIEELIKTMIGSRKRLTLKIIGLETLVAQHQRKAKKEVSLVKNGVYDLLINNVQIPVFYIGDEKFLIIIDLETLGYKKEDFEKNVLGNVRKFVLTEPSDEAQRPEVICKLSGKEDNIEIKLSLIDDAAEEYYPYIPILADPTTFMCLVPLRDAFKIAKLIKREYEVEFSKVQNRLPLKLGIIGFKRKFPLYIVFDAAKRFLEEEILPEFFKVEDIANLDLNKTPSDTEANIIKKEYGSKLGNYITKLELLGSKSKKKFKVYVSYSTGDPTIKDYFYPYFVLKNGKSDDWETLLYTDYIERINKIAGANWVNEIVKLRHVSELSKGEEVLFEQSLFDFEFLDSNLRRFDLGKQRRHWLFRNSKITYLLWDIDKFDELRDLLIRKLNLTVTQIRNVYEILLSKFEDWHINKVPVELQEEEEEDNKNVYTLLEQLVETVIFSYPLRLTLTDEDESSEGKITEKDYNFLKETIMNGMFFDFVNLFFSILKYNVEELKGG